MLVAETAWLREPEAVHVSVSLGDCVSLALIVIDGVCVSDTVCV